MAVIIELTQLSPTMEEGTFVKWIKNKGEAVEPGEVLAEVETDKAVMEMESYDEGILLVQLAGEGDRLPVGAPIGIIGEVGEEVSDLLAEAENKLKAIQAGHTAPKSEPASSASKSAEAASTTTSDSDAEGESESKSTPAATGGSTPRPAAGQSSGDNAVALAADQHPDRPIPTERSTAAKRKPGSSITRTGRILASPLARRIAHEHGVELGRVQGTGPGGRITKSDVKEHMRIMNGLGVGGAHAAGQPARPDKRVEISGMRKVIAERLHDAKNNIPHFYLTLEFDAEPLVRLRTSLNNDLSAAHTDEDEDAPRVSYNDLIVKACALTLAKHPVCNSSWRGDHILQHGRIDVGVAVAIDGGLITPYVRDADRMLLMRLGAKIRELGRRARERKLKPEEYTDGTFTTSNLGMFGLNNFSAIINEPEAALMAIGGLIDKAVVRDGQLVAGKTMTVTLSCDHRVIDGAEGARFLETFRNFIEHPHLLLV